MTGPRTRFGIAVRDAHDTHSVIAGWYDDRAEAERVILERYQGNAYIVLASGVLGWSSDHDQPFRRPGSV